MIISRCTGQYLRSRTCLNVGRSIKSLHLTRGCFKLIGPLAVLALSSCSTSPGGSTSVGVPAQSIAPRLVSDIALLENTSAIERAHLQLIATNLVSTLVQVPTMQSSIRTLQVSSPKTAYGHAIVRALEDASYGLQLVSADQGQNYVSYSKRLSETESGWVTDYSLGVGKILVSREYSVKGQAIYPSSLMNVAGASSIANIELTDDIFAEQGGDGDAFISGVQVADQPDPDIKVRTIDVNDYDEIPTDKRTTQNAVLQRAQKRYFEINALRNLPDLDSFEKYRRTVLVFNNTTTRLMGSGNKRAVRLLTRGFNSGDIMLIKACQDADGVNEAAMDRAIRVEEELTGLGVPAETTYIAPCARTNYRHSSDDSPVPVELIHYRPKT